MVLSQKSRTRLSKSQIVLIEEFKNCVHSDVRTYLDEHNIETLENAA